MSFYSKSKLMEVVKDRGYTTTKAVAMALAPIFGVGTGTMKSKLRYGKFTIEECEVIGAFFDMTMKEYYQVFMEGLFQEDADGHYKAHIDNYVLHLKPDLAKMSPQRRHQLNIEKAIDQIKELEYEE